jgi:nitroimidazol reductase NimA-like FMN-containing flavoprotein (pyridoxamine 5'-phosphate oxidase superfamily)
VFKSEYRLVEDESKKTEELEEAKKTLAQVRANLIAKGTSQEELALLGL